MLSGASFMRSVREAQESYVQYQPTGMQRCHVCHRVIGLTFLACASMGSTTTSSMLLLSMRTEMMMKGRQLLVSDEFYTGLALILDIGENPNIEPWPRPWYCHLLDLCDHEDCTDDCE
jgi:hypothetical protein